jgi:hypothetical protein
VVYFDGPTFISCDGLTKSYSFTQNWKSEQILSHISVIKFEPLTIISLDWKFFDSSSCAITQISLSNPYSPTLSRITILALKYLKCQTSMKLAKWLLIAFCLKHPLSRTAMLEGMTSIFCQNPMLSYYYCMPKELTSQTHTLNGLSNLKKEHQLVTMLHNQGLKSKAKHYQMLIQIQS